MCCGMRTIESNGRAPHEALALLAASPPEAFRVVLSDAIATLHAPYAWLELLHAATTAPIIIYSAQPARLYADYANRGFAACLAKPFDLTALVQLVAAVSARPADARD